MKKKKLLDQLTQNGELHRFSGNHKPQRIFRLALPPPIIFESHIVYVQISTGVHQEAVAANSFPIRVVPEDGLHYLSVLQPDAGGEVHVDRAL